MASSENAPAIGIDLGTTYCCVGVLWNGKVHIIKTEQGKSTFPSYVAFTENGRLVGERAKQYTLIDPENTINNMKRLIGRTMNDEHVKEHIKHYPFKVVAGENNEPLIQVKHSGQDKQLRPEEVSSILLTELKIMAEEYLKIPVKKAVITVPAYFTDAQRQATLDAGRIAGLDVLGTVNEPTAAAMAYGFDNPDTSEESTLLVYDFGGGTFDVSVLSVENGEVKVLSKKGNPNLGGEDIDNILVKHFVSEFHKKNKVDLTEKAKTDILAKKALRRLQLFSEKAKIKLSYDRSASVDLDLLYGDADFQATITRVFFEKMCEELFRSTLEPVLQAVEEANLARSSINKIVLVGGSSRIPMVGSLLNDIFVGPEFCGNINPDEAVAYGAAIQAAILSGVDKRLVHNVHLQDVTSLSLGIDTFGGLMATMVYRGTPIPARKCKVFSTSRDYQTEICFQVYEGERHATCYNLLLGEFTLVGIPPAPKRLPQIEVSFNVDANGILKVKAIDLSTDTENEVEITNRQGRLSEEEIERKIEEAKQMREEDQKFKRKVQSRETMEELGTKIAKSLRNPKVREKIDSEQVKKLEKTIDETLRMYESYQNPGEADFEEKHIELESLWNPLVSKLWPDRRQNPDAPVFHESENH